MATFKICIPHSDRKSDSGYYSVSIRLTHQRKSVFIQTGIQVSSRQIKKGEVSDPHIIATLNNRIIELQSFLVDLGIVANNYSAAELKDFLIRKENERNHPCEKGIMLYEFWTKEFINTIQTESTKSLYLNSSRNFIKFCKGNDVNTSDITLRFLLEYEEWLKKTNVGARGINLYMTHLKKVFSFARDLYNDEDTGIIRIPNNPFSKYKIPLPPPPKQEGDLNPEQLLSIINYKPAGIRETIARDCFVMSLFLAGINSVDLYNAKTLSKDWVLEYERSKTKTRRQDHAIQKITVPECLRGLFEKYRDKTGERVLNFHKRFATHNELNRSINKGLKIIGKNIGLPGLYYYQARHSFATIAHNDLNFNMEDIGKCLTHVPLLRVTASYIKQDFSVVDKVNEAVIKYILACCDMISF